MLNIEPPFYLALDSSYTEITYKAYIINRKQKKTVSFSSILPKILLKLLINLYFFVDI